MSSPNSPIKSSSSRLAVLFGSSSMLLFCFAMMIMMSAGPIKSVEAGWNLEWSDDFSGTSLDKSKWQVEVMCWAGNGERQCYTDRSDNVYVTGGNLHLKAKKENYRGSAIGCTNNNENSCTWTKPTTSGRIRSKFAVDGSWKYGRFEVRARLPRGDFLWPAIWMLPTDEVYGGWPRSGEIDIMEARGQNPTKTSSAVHFGDPVPNNKHTASGDVESPSSVDLTAGFHVYSAEWDASAIKFFVDGKLKWTQSLDRSFGDRYNKRGAPFDQRFHFVMNLAVGGKFFNEARYGVFDANRDPRTWSQPSLIVDYARAYKWVNGGDSSPTTQSTPAPSSPPSSATCTKDTIVTSEDTFFDSGRPTLNFGKDQLLLVRKTGAKIRQAFLKFQLPSSASPSNLPTKATLELFGSGEEADGVISVKINAAPISWSADSMTYESRPASCTNNCFSSTLSAGQNPAWREVNILNLVRDAITRRQTHVSVALALDQDGYASFNSLEAGTGLPKLSLEFGKCS